MVKNETKRQAKGGSLFDGLLKQFEDWEGLVRRTFEAKVCFVCLFGWLVGCLFGWLFVCLFVL